MIRRAGRAVLVVFYLSLACAILVAAPRGLVEAFARDFEGDMRDPVSDLGLGHYRFIRAHLEAPFEGFTERETLIPAFRAVALSNMACGLLNLHVLRPEMKSELEPLIGEVVRRMLLPSISVYGADPHEVEDLGTEGMYLSHLNLSLGCFRRITGDTRHDALHIRVSEHLAGLSLRDGDFHARSFRDFHKWPADQSALLCSLYLFDQTHGTDLSDTPIRGWLSWMEANGTDSSTGLPRSEITNEDHGRLPRGCALSWSSHYMAQFAPEEAVRLYAAYRRVYYQQTLGLGGFREWPPGIDLGSNADAGAVFLGYGLSASGIGIGPARLFRDRRSYVALMRTASVVGMPAVSDGRREYRLAPLLGEAMLFSGQTSTRWYGDIADPGFPEAPVFPWGAVVFLSAYAVVLAFCVFRLRRLVRGV